MHWVDNNSTALDRCALTVHGWRLTIPILDEGIALVAAASVAAHIGPPTDITPVVHWRRTLGGHAAVERLVKRGAPLVGVLLVVLLEVALLVLLLVLRLMVRLLVLLLVLRLMVRLVAVRVGVCVGVRVGARVDTVSRAMPAALAAAVQAVKGHGGLARVLRLLRLLRYLLGQAWVGSVGAGLVVLRRRSLGRRLSTVVGVLGVRAAAAAPWGLVVVVVVVVVGSLLVALDVLSRQVRSGCGVLLRCVSMLRLLRKHVLLGPSVCVCTAMVRPRRRTGTLHLRPRRSVSVSVAVRMCLAVRVALALVAVDHSVQEGPRLAGSAVVWVARRPTARKGGGSRTLRRHADRALVVWQVRG